MADRAANFVLCGVAVVGLISQVVVPWFRSPLSKLDPDLADWLVTSSLEQYAQHFVNTGATDLYRAVEVPAVPFLPLADQEHMTAMVYQLKQRLVLQEYLTHAELTTHVVNRLAVLGVHSLHEAAFMADTYLEQLRGEGEDDRLLDVLQGLPRSDAAVGTLVEEVWQGVARQRGLPSAARSALAVLLGALLLAVSGAFVLCLCLVALLRLGIVRDPDAEEKARQCWCRRNSSSSSDLATTQGFRATQVTQFDYNNVNSIRPILLQCLGLGVANEDALTRSSRPVGRPPPSLRPRYPYSCPTCPHHPTTLILPASFNAFLHRLASPAVIAFGLLLLVCDLTRRVLARLWYEMTRSLAVIGLGGGGGGRPDFGCVFKPGGFLQLFTSKCLNPKKCVTTFHWTEPVTVGTTVSFTVQFYQRNGRPYPVSDADNVLVEVTHGVHKVSMVSEVGGCSEEDLNSIRCQFTARQAGEYTVAAVVGQTHLKGSPFTKTFLPGPPCPQNTTLVGHSSTVVCVAMEQHMLLLEPRDQYHNLCTFATGEEEPEAYTLHVTEATESSGVEVCNSVVLYDSTSRRYVLNFLLRRPGCYRARIDYQRSTLPQGVFTIIVVTAEDSERVRQFVQRRQLDGLEAQLVPTVTPVAAADASGATTFGTKPRKIYCYITPKQLIIKEYLFKIIPMRVCTFRLCPSTKLDFNQQSSSGLPTLTIDDGCQPPVTLATKDRSVIAATFTQFLLKNIGGSETFKDKQDHFYHQVRKFHSKRPHDRLPIYVSREKLLESSMKATRNFTVSDWCKSFDVTFLKEEGLDWGGVGREWVELLCMELFDTKGGLFTSFAENSPQALVHPNPLRPSHLKYKYYEFAGRLVGKCLYESALGGKFHLTVRARFSRSFLAQIIGLRVHYTHFAQDDPELYQGKVQHLLLHGTDLLPEPIYFTDQQLNSAGSLETVELEVGGFTREVTNSNKLQYLDSLAQYRLAARVHGAVQAFLYGLNEIIPDNLLCIFDENELELLMCGTEKYSIADLKAHHLVSGGTPEFKRVLYWFWTAIANFTEEEMARLLQFTTGCSRLPPGGFSQLSPQFHIMPSHTYNCLPIAHTCFNQLGLPDYDTYEQFEKCLLIAIKEGSEGFGLV